MLGIGAGFRMWIEGQAGIPYTMAAAAMRETIEIVRALFGGGDVTYQGRVFKRSGLNLHFRPPRAIVPAYLGVFRPSNLETAGRLADGIILSVMTSPAYARYAVDHVRAGADKAGNKLEHFEVCANLFISISQDETAARDAVKPLIAMLLAVMMNQADHRMFAVAGFEPEEIRRFGEARARGESPVGLVTDKFVDGFAIAGGPSGASMGLQNCWKQG